MGQLVGPMARKIQGINIEVGQVISEDDPLAVSFWDLVC